MRIEIWMDFVCPFCYLGKHRLARALEQVNLKEPVDILYRSFELSPKAPLRSGKLVPEQIAAAHGIELDAAIASVDDIRDQGLEIGLDMHLRTAPVTNTFDAHRLTQMVFNSDPKLAMELIEKLFYAYFTEHKDIGDPSVLIELAESLGIDRDSVVDVLVTDAYSKEVRADEKRSRDVGLQGVPHFLFDEQYAVSGAQAPKTFAKVIERIVEERL